MCSSDLMDPGYTISVLIIDDSRAFLNSARMFLGMHREIRIVAEAEIAATGIALALRHQPDVILVDLAMSPLNGIATARELRQAGVRAPIVLMTVMESELVRPQIDPGVIDACLAKADFAARAPELVRALAGRDASKDAKQPRRSTTGNGWPWRSMRPA